MAITENALIDRVTEEVIKRLEKKKLFKPDFERKAGGGGGGTGDGGVTQWKYLSDTPKYPSEFIGKADSIPVLDDTEEDIVFHSLGDMCFRAPFDFTVITGSWSLSGGGIAQWCGWLLNTPDNNLDEIHFPVWLQKGGKYNVTLLTRLQNSNGILEIRLNDTLIDTFDGYAMIRTNNYEHKISNVTIPYAGTHLLKIKVNGRNASAIGYNALISGFLFIRTA